MAAKVDKNALQDGFQLYHHLFVFTADGAWRVIQQGMDESSLYHWLSKGVDDFVLEPHSGILGDASRDVLNLVAKESEAVRQASTQLVTDPKEVLRVLRDIHAGRYAKQLTLPPGHAVPNADRLDRILYQILYQIYEVKPETYRDLVGLSGVGASTLRALAMVAEVVYGAKPSREDPVRYSFAHGGKDGHPRPVNRRDYDTSIRVLQQAIEQARLGNRDKLETLRRLGKWEERADAWV